MDRKPLTVYDDLIQEINPLKSHQQRRFTKLANEKNVKTISKKLDMRFLDLIDETADTQTDEVFFLLVVNHP